MAEPQFGEELARDAAPPQATAPPPGNVGSTAGRPAGVGQGNTRAESVIDDEVPSGASNVSRGVVRKSRRGINGLAKNRLGGLVAKNYRTSTAVMFNNVVELFQDCVSREYAQEILEELFAQWGVPVQQPEVAKYAEDLVVAFLIATTASNKANYNKVFDIPVKGGEGIVAADFSMLSRLLESGHGVTRRQFARGMADDMAAYLRQEDNSFMLPILATRVGCEAQYAYLAFDGSTNCTGMTTVEVQFTKTLEARNLFERDDLLAQGSSDKLMAGMSTGPRSIKAR